MNNMMVMNAEEATSSGETPQENIQVFLRMRPLNQRELGEEQAVCAWRIVDQQSVTLDQSLFSGSHGGRYIVPAGAYASLLAPSSGGGNQSKAYTFSKLRGRVLNFSYRRVLQSLGEQHGGL
jgi:hypothetical protein